MKIKMRFIGNKLLLLDNINKVIDENVTTANIFCDIFAGSSCVSKYFKSKYKIYCNDILHFSYILQRASIGLNYKPNFKILIKTLHMHPIDYFNNLDISTIESLPQNNRFFQNNYSPLGNRMYLSIENALRIDFYRNTIDKWKFDNLISEDEYCYILACIIESIPYVSNIAGTYGAFLKSWDKRATNKLKLKSFDIIDNKHNNICFNVDGIKLLKNISGDILYIDPPYNTRQYAPNYHILETVSRYDNPYIKGITGQQNYENQKSKFCSKKTATYALDELLQNANFKHIILSYSNEGIIAIDKIKELLCTHGDASTFKSYEILYRKYKSRGNFENNLKEYIFYITKGELI